MNQEAIRKTILEEVSRGDISDAFSQLIAYLDAAPAAGAWLTAARLQQTEYNLHREKELQGITTTEENRIALNRAAKVILEILEEALPDASTSTPLPRPRSLPQWIYLAVAGAFLLVVGLGWSMISQSPNSGKDGQELRDKLQQAPLQPLGITCPTFSPNASFKVAVFPFKPLSELEIAVHTQIIQEFDRTLLGDDPSIRMVGLIKNIDVTKRFPDFALADSLLRSCGADMVVWGTYLSDRSINISFYCPLFEKKVRQDLDSLIQSRNQGEFTAGIKVAVRLLTARLYLAKGQPDQAIPIAKGAQQSAKQGNYREAESMATMTLAQAYIRAGEPDKAIAQYDTILSKNPKHALALNNKAVLAVKRRDTNAIKLVERAITVNRRSAGLHLLASEKYEQVGRPDKALESLEKAGKLAPDNPTVQQRIETATPELEREKSTLTRKGLLPVPKPPQQQ